MTSSGMKRGLAVTAVSALAVTGLPFLTVSANATPLSAQAGGADQVVLYSQFNAGNDASVKNDGTNTTVSLVAGGGTSVEAVKFEYSLDGTTFTPINLVVTARDGGGAYSTEWSVDPLLYGATVTLRATGYAEDGAITVLDTVTQAGVELRGPLAAEESVEIGGTEFRVFQQPYGGANDRDLGIVTGTTSAIDGSVTISARSGGATGSASAPVTAGTPGTTPPTPNTFKGVLDISGYSYGSFATPGQNQIVLGAERDTDDAEAVNIVNQTLTAVTATAAGPAPAGGTTTVTVTVKDQDGLNVVGAQVYDTNGNRLIGYTDINGQVKDTAAAGGDHRYYANRTSNPAFEPGIDPSFDVTVTNYIQVPTTAIAASDDGPAFDDDEYAAGDIYVTVKDQNGNPVAGRTVEYYWDVPGTAPNNRVPTGTAWSTATTGSDGKATVVFPTSAPSGDYVLHYRVPADSNGQGAIPEQPGFGIKAGQAALVLTTNPAETGTPPTAEGTAGSTVTVDGTLKLEDGTVLPGRVVDLTYTRGTESAPGNGTADAGIVDGTNIVLSKSVKTGTLGAIPQQTIKDQAETPQGSELGGKLAAETGNTTPTQTNTLDGDAGAADSANIDFNSTQSVGSVTLSAGQIINDDEGVPMPGRPIRYTITILNDAGTNANMGGKTVAVDLTAGTLFEVVGGNPVAEGTEYGDWKAAANQTTVTTDTTGVATIIWGMEREAGFDDDGMVTGKVTVANGGKSDDDTRVFYSGTDAGAINPTTGQQVSGGMIEPLNGGSVDLEFAAQSKQESSVLPKASTGQTVFFDLVTTDQFGNRVKQDVEISDGSSPAGFNTNGVGSTALSQWTGEQPAVEAFSNQATNQTLFSNWTAPVNSSEFVTTTEVLSDSTPETVNWYEVDYSASSFTMTNNTGDNRVTVGTAVTERVVARDQEGQPIAGLQVEFIRSGPNEQQGDVNATRFTNANGVAFYSYVGDTAGSATVTAVISDNGVVLDQLSNTVVFEAARQRIAANLKLSNNAKGNDVAFVNAPSAAAGAKVRLFRVRANGTRVLIRTKTANAAGNARFVVFDKNKRQLRTFQARVLRTAKTWADWTPKRRIR